MEFKTQELSDELLGEKNKEKIGSRYIELFPSSRAEKRRTVRSKSGGDRGKGGGRGGFAGEGRDVWGKGGGDCRSKGSEYVMRMRGLPFSASVREVDS